MGSAELNSHVFQYLGKFIVDGLEIRWSLLIWGTGDNMRSEGAIWIGQ
jgi:hypothetical protein